MMYRVTGRRLFITLLALWVGLSTISPLWAAENTRIAIVDLDSQGDKAKKDELGMMASQVLTAEFVKAGRFDVIERQALKKIVEEQQLGLSGLVDATTAARLGRVLGAQYIVTGAVISYPRGMDLVVKIVETESASIKVADRLSATTSAALFRKITGFVSQIADQFPLRGMVVYKKGKAYTIDMGKREGIRKGMRFEVYREGQPIKHPMTGEILGREKVRSGLIKIIDVQEKIAVGTVVRLAPNQEINIGHRVVSAEGPSPSASVTYGGASSGALRYIRSWGRKGTGTADFYLPYGIAADAEGNVYVADTYNNRIQVFDPSGIFLRSWGQKGTGQGQLLLPYDVAVDRQGNVYVADTYNFRIQKFNATGRFILQWGRKGQGIGEFAFLSGVAAGPEGSVYTTDAKMHRVQVFDGDGRYLRSWGQGGAETGNFAAPMGIAVDNNGTVYVADSEMKRVQVFGSQGNFQHAITGTMVYPADVAVAQNSGSLYVIDAASHYFWEMSSTGQVLMTFGGAGNGSSQFIKPYGICTDDAGNVYVADTANCRVQKFSRE
jgi:DNA-binding beta-propeller fold protein YncE/TolB-like protein